MPTAELAERVSQALEAENIGAGVMYHPDDVDYHVYAHWAPIMGQHTWTPQGGPWRWGAPVEYRRDMCPRTLDLLSRAVHMDVNPLLSGNDVEETIIGVNKVLRSASAA
jgi:hypothetical protein